VIGTFEWWLQIVDQRSKYSPNYGAHNGNNQVSSGRRFLKWGDCQQKADNELQKEGSSLGGTYWPGRLSQ
jgi:hypothetical protein